VLAQVQRERDAALATIARVEALLDDHDGAYWAICGVREIRAALEES
jgi:hypothetical protein